jgi:itaconate CoA-transferase
MYAYTNILAALIQRGRTGKGCRIDVSMLESMTEWMSFPLYYAYEGAPPPVRAGAAHATIYPYGPFPAGDGKIVMLGLQNEREWVLFCEKVLLQPALATDTRFDSSSKRSSARKALYEIICSSFAALTAEQIIERLDDAPIACARLNDMHELWDHAQLRARDRWASVASPAGEVRAPLPPGVSSAWEARMDAIPALGEHTRAILAELGYAADAVDVLATEKAI